MDAQLGSRRPPDSADYTALITVTTCERLPYLRRYLPHLAQVCAGDPRFRLLVSLDGTEPNVLDFCEQWGVPLVYSDEREGVGLSKNRVLERFPDFDYYFFLEDDVELVDTAVFPAHVDLFRKSGIHHFSLFVADGVRKVISASSVGEHRVLHALYGGADFNFFTREGLRRVGGWHPLFARYRRFGHTEHSYRFARTALAPAPFNVAIDLSNTCIWHVPPAVTSVTHVSYDADQIARPERELMEQELEHVPVQTLSSHHYNGVPFGSSARLAATLDDRERYPLVRGSELRHARSDYHLWRFETGAPPGRALALLKAAGQWPGSPALRHRLKVLLRP